MNVLRSKAVELSQIPAVAYKQKLKSGGAGVKILRLDNAQTAVAEVDKRTGEPVLLKNCDEQMFPYEVFEEAIELTRGLPFSARGKIVVRPHAEAEAEEGDEAAPANLPDVTNSAEYAAIVARYSDEKGKINYSLLNKDFIQFAAKSKVVADMVADCAQTADILLFIVKNRAAYAAEQKEHLPDGEALALIDALDEIDPRSAFKELKAYINRLLARAKKK